MGCSSEHPPWCWGGGRGEDREKPMLHPSPSSQAVGQQGGGKKATHRVRRRGALSEVCMKGSRS